MIVAVRVHKPMNKPQYFDLMVDGFYTASVWGTGHIRAQRGTGARYMVSVRGHNSMTYTDAFFHVDKVIVRE